MHQLPGWSRLERSKGVYVLELQLYHLWLTIPSGSNTLTIYHTSSTVQHIVINITVLALSLDCRCLRVTPNPRHFQHARNRYTVQARCALHWVVVIYTRAVQQLPERQSYSKTARRERWYGSLSSSQASRASRAQVDNINTYVQQTTLP